MQTYNHTVNLLSADFTSHKSHTHAYTNGNFHSFLCQFLKAEHCSAISLLQLY